MNDDFIFFCIYNRVTITMDGMGPLFRELNDNLSNIKLSMDIPGMDNLLRVVKRMLNSSKNSNKQY